MSRDPEAPYFLGSIVLIKDEDRANSQVVDGQQRLTTLVMVLCALREFEQDETRDHIDVFIRQKGNPFKGTIDQFRLRVRVRDRDFFDTYIQTSGSLNELFKLNHAALSDTQKRIALNAKHIHQSLQEMSDERRRALLQFMVQSCFLVVVTATDRDSAYRIFSVMNDRGLDLSPTDILKAESIGTLAIEDQIAYGEKWEGVEDELGRDDFRDLFTHIRMIKAKAKLRQSLQADFQQNVLATLDSSQFVDDLLIPYANVYGAVKRAAYESPENSEDVNRYLRLLGRLDNYDWIPPAIEFLIRNAHDHQLLARFIKDLERLAYGLFVRRAYVNERISRYGEVLRTIERDEDPFLPNSPLQLRAPEAMEIAERLDGDIYLQPYVVRRVLLERVDTLIADVGATYDQAVISIEHVLPQNPGPDSEWCERFPTQDLRDNWTHKLANLVLLSRRKNSRASNWGFERKKREYFQRDGVSSFPLTTQVLSETEWTPTVLEKRQRFLLDALGKEWRILPYVNGSESP